MKSLGELKKELTVTRQLELITEAMEHSGAATVMRLKDRIISTRPYFQETWDIYRVLRQLVPLSPDVKPRTLYILVTLNNGLHGGLLKRLMENFVARYKEKEGDILITGTKGRSYLAPYSDRTVYYFSLNNDVRYEEIEPLKQVIGTYQELVVLYPRYRTPFLQEVEALVLQVKPKKETDEKRPQRDDKGSGTVAAEQYAIEPDLKEVSNLFNRTILGMVVYTCFMEAIVAYNAAQMVSMHNAWENASKARKHLTSTYQRRSRERVDQKLRELHRSMAKGGGK